MYAFSKDLEAQGMLCVPVRPAAEPPGNLGRLVKVSGCLSRHAAMLSLEFSITGLQDGLDGLQGLGSTRRISMIQGEVSRISHMEASRLVCSTDMRKISK